MLAIAVPLGLALALSRAGEDSSPARAASVRASGGRHALSPGSRCRVRTVAGDTLRGTLVSIGADRVTLALDRQARPVEVPRREIRRLDVSAGSKRWRRRHILLGALVGLAAGSALAYHYIDAEPPFAERKAATSLVAGPALGGLLGGAAFPGEAWEPVALSAVPPHAAPGVGRRLAFRVRLSF